MNSMATFASAADSALRSYQQSGLHVEPGVFADGFCDHLVAEANRFPAVVAGDYRTALQPHRRSDLFLQALKHPQVAGIIRRLLGGDISGIQTQFFYCKPGTPGFQAHQDNRFVNAPQGAFASVWIALVDVSPENGGLIMYPGSHNEPLLDVVDVPYQESVLQDSNAVRLKCVVPDAYKPMDLSLKKGAAAFFDGHTVHASHANRSAGHRYSLLMTYVRRGVPFTAGTYAQRDEVAIPG
jgi:ectoine hydroxylase-related dioxygenase (phytanoyl-CoA dioxygenase family)